MRFRAVQLIADEAAPIHVEGRRHVIEAHQPLRLLGRHARHGEWKLHLAEEALQTLRVLVENAARIVAKEALIEAVWSDAAIADNTLDRAVSDLRKAIDLPDGSSRIDNVKRQGYRFTMPVERVVISEHSVALAALLAPRKVQLESRAALDTWDAGAIARTPEQIEAALCDAPDDGALHTELAMAYALVFESTRDDETPDRVALEKALFHAHEGVRLARASAEAWSVLGFVFGLDGKRQDAIAACLEAIGREPDNWRHWIRIGHAWWGEDRIRAAQRILSLISHLAIAHWLAATVFIARQAFGEALEHLRAGCAAQDAQPAGGGRFTMVGLHLLHGLVLLEQGPIEPALEEFRRELAGSTGQMYSRECLANTCYAMGAALVRLGRFDEARQAFLNAFTYIKGHGRATAGLAVLSGAIEITGRWHEANPVDAAIVRAVPLACAGLPADGAALIVAALEHAEAGQSGWQLPIEPLLHVSAHPDVWAKALAMVRHRAA